MDIQKNWPEIQQVVTRGQASSIHCAIASVGPDGQPNITPVGTVFLRDDQTGYYFDQYTQALARNLDSNASICLMAVNTGSLFWLRSLLRGRFLGPPGVRLYGTAGSRRPATPEELERVHRRVGAARWLKGGRLLWSSFSHVRDIRFTSFRPIVYPVMMEHLWQQDV